MSNWNEEEWVEEELLSAHQKRKKDRDVNLERLTEMVKAPEGYFFGSAQIFTPFKAYVTVASKTSLIEYLLDVIMANKLHSLIVQDGECHNCDSQFLFVLAPEGFSIPVLACVIFHKENVEG